jgi:peptidoglycan-associated lipoprotein
LTDNPNIAIELSAHTDMVGNDANNQELSQKRAQSVVDYLIKAGIDKGRLTPKGYGETKPVVVSEELAEQYKLFLRKGDVLTPEFIETLTVEQQEICNQINRRTEFKVTKTTYNLY